MAYDWAWLTEGVWLMEMRAFLLGMGYVGVACKGGMAYHWAWLMGGAWLIIGLRLYGCGLQRGRGICLGVDYGEAMACDWAWIMWAWLTEWAWLAKGAWLLNGYS